MTDVLEKFWSQVNKTGGCWLWTGKLTYRSYGSFYARYDGHKWWRAHRFSWYIHNGEIPENLYVLHKCDNPWCVNPDHLWLGTHKQNQDDKVAKMRHQHGERVHTAKLTVADVIAIRASSKTNTELGKVYNVHDSHIHRIKSGKAWKSVPAETQQETE